jgi:hypothetical protein
MLIKRPDRRDDRRVVAVDEERLPQLPVRRMAGEVDLSDKVGRDGVDVGERVATEVTRADVDVVEVEEQAAAGAAAGLGQKLWLLELAVEREVERGVLDEEHAAQRRLHLVDMRDQGVQSLPRGGYGQQVRVINPVPTRPGDVLGDQSRLKTVDQRPETSQMLRIKRLGAAKRGGYAV